jgi:hypothetical protein
MSNSKISALTSATTPLAGTETLPVVQSSTTKQVSVANLTAGRAVSGLTFQSTQTTGTAPFTVASTTNVANLNASSLNGATFAAPGAIGGGTASTGNFTSVSATGAITGLTFNGAYTGAGSLRINASQARTITVAVSGTPNALRIGFGGDLDNNGAFWGVVYDVNGSMVVASTYSVATTNSFTNGSFTISAVTKNSNNFTFVVTNGNATYGGTIQFYFISAANGAVTVS